MFQRLLHILYAIEFLIALIAVFTVWSQVGGQGHLDYMAWYWKAAIGIPAAFSAVKLTILLASDHPQRKRRILAWTALLIFLALSAGGLTYYYHLNEPLDEDNQDSGVSTRTALPGSADHDAGIARYAQCTVCRFPGVPNLPS